LPLISIRFKVRFCLRTTMRMLEVAARAVVNQHPTNVKNASTLRCYARAASFPCTSSIPSIILANGAAPTSNAHCYHQLALWFILDIVERSARTASLDLGVTPWSFIQMESITFVLNIVAATMYQRPFSSLDHACFLPQWKGLRPHLLLRSSTTFICTV